MEYLEKDDFGMVAFIENSLYEPGNYNITGRACGNRGK